MRSFRALDAGAGRGAEVERAGFGVFDCSAYGCSCKERAEVGLWGTRFGGSEARRAEEGAADFQEARRVALHRKGRNQLRPGETLHGESDLRDRREDRGDGLRVD